MSEDTNLNMETALRNREFEIQLFWQRANYFLVLVTALGVGVFSSNKPPLGLLMSGFAALTCWLWFRTNLGSRFWQMFWEDEVERLAPLNNLNAFLVSTTDIQARLTEKQKTKKNSSHIRKWIDRQVITKPSATYHMILLSFFALIFWVLISLYFIYQIASPIFTSICNH